MTETTTHIVITGAMGVGKTTVGRLLAADMGIPFADSDFVIEERLGRTGEMIASRQGVAHLHELELGVFLEMCREETPTVIAPAASVVDDPTGRAALEANFTVWLTAPDDVLAQRQASGDHRRVVDAAARAVLHAERSPALREVSTLILETGGVEPSEVVSRIVERLPESFAQVPTKDS